MLVIGFPAQVFGTNCYVVAPAAGEECLVVDPGIGVLGQLSAVLEEHGLRPAAVLATHGHLDHVYSVTPVCQAHGVAVRVHGADTYRLVDPAATLGPELRAMFEQQFGKDGWHEPDDVVELEHGQKLTIAGIELDVVHAPGHTEGSVIFTVPGVPSSLDAGHGLTSTAFAGDVLFAGSIGRTDLPGGSGAAMMRSLRERVLPMADDTLVLPGHGPATTIGRERASNPYLREEALR
ncbi:MBL fold metallo-hydrolase [Spongisporangium articulatum]|uniref:MBL fold metallo-hydrolase n=1 Tax=Spongisporangium articulatum TaxID=3362603 RepID=A0ABW8AR59_9ACTN